MGYKMNLQDIGLFKIAGQQLNWLSARQAVLAQNIANVNTPEYLPKDLDKLDFSRVLKANDKVLTSSLSTSNPSHLSSNSRGVSLIKTHPMHIGIPSSSFGGYVVHSVKPSYETSLDGNGVIVEEEIAKMDSTRSNYDLVASIYQKNIGLINLALGNNN